MDLLCNPGQEVCAPTPEQAAAIAANQEPSKLPDKSYWSAFFMLGGSSMYFLSLYGNFLAAVPVITGKNQDWTIVSLKPQISDYIELYKTILKCRYAELAAGSVTAIIGIAQFFAGGVLSYFAFLFALTGFVATLTLFEIQVLDYQTTMN
jgi:hypothetical protein